MLLLLHTSPLALLFITTFDLFWSAQARLTIEQLFDVSYDRAVGGHCADYGSGRLNLMLGDAEDLADAGILMVQGATDVSDLHYDEAFRATAAWWANPYLNTAQYQQIAATYKAASDWINGHLTVVDGGTSTAKPLLICGDNDFTLRQTMNDQAFGFDANGREIKLTHPDGRPYLIKDNPDYVMHQAAASEALKQQAYPHWCSRLKQYIFDRPHGANQLPTDYICAAKPGGKLAAYGVTKSYVALSKVSAVFLCPASFRNSGKRTRSVAPTCMDAKDLVNTRPPNGNAAGITNSNQIHCDGETLFHEIIHLVLGNGATMPSTGEEYVATAILGKRNRASGKPMTTEESLVNPQTYVFAAEGFDYTLNYIYGAPTGPNIEFYTGYCTYQT